jgi:DNA-binding transcriptional LysR family regulator
MSLSIDALKSFVVLAEELHFGRAALRLHVSQPALTKQIKRLEAEIGGRLFERTTGRVQLTPAGDALKDALLSWSLRLRRWKRSRSGPCRGIWNVFASDLV